MRRQYDGFWFPSIVRDAMITPGRQYDYLHFKEGRLVDADAASGDETVTVRWPRLTLDDWHQVFTLLQGNRRQAHGMGWHRRLPQAMHRMYDIWTDRANPLRQDVLQALAVCTGHSVGMLDFALSLLDLVSLDDLQRAASGELTHAVKGDFAPLGGLPGRVRFFEDKLWRRLATRALLHWSGYRQRPWRLRRKCADTILGYAAGNVPGTGLLLILLGLAAAACEEADPPVIVVKNSRREPLFTPLVLTALELIDPALVSTTLVTLWDYADTALQEYLAAQADLVVAAASDETIHDIDRMVRRMSTRSHPIRFHGHGHKVSFSTIGREGLQVGQEEPESGHPLLEVIALLASLDVALWDQQGCLSSRVHFVEQGGGEAYHPPEAYGRAVVRGLRTLSEWMPKGVPGKRRIHNRFDKYQAIAAGGLVQVLSEYDDDFLVVLDRRPLTGDQFREVVNDCQGRTVVIVPVDDVMEAPDRYLKQVRREHLQTMSVALGALPTSPSTAEGAGGETLDPRLLRYAEALGAAGVTGIRTVGRGAFPQLAYSWDGWIPLDLNAERADGYFTALEFDQPWTQIYETYRLVRRAMDLKSAGVR